MSSSRNSEETGRKESEDLTISVAMANNLLHSPGPNGGRRLLEIAPAEPNRTSATETNLPPSPLVTPPLGSNGSYLAQQAVSPRNLLPTDHSSGDSPYSNGDLQSPDDEKNPQKGIPHVYHDYAKLSGPGPAYIRKKTGGVTQRKFTFVTMMYFCFANRRRWFRSMSIHPW